MPALLSKKARTPEAEPQAFWLGTKKRKEIVRPGHKVEAAGDVTGGKCLS